MLKNKKPIVALILTLCICKVSTTLAYYSNTTKYTNEFQTAKYKTNTTQVFVAPTNWQAGETISKTITTKNEGTIPVVVRASLDEKWYDENDQEIFVSGAVTINFDNTTEWIQEGNYYYYKYILNPNDETLSFIQSVTLNNVVGNVTCTVSGLSQVCETLNPATGKKYVLTVNIETIGTDDYKTIWNTNLNIVENNS